MRVLKLFLLSILLTNLAFAQNSDGKNSVIQSDSLIGEWMLDLRPTPDAAPYLQTLIISKQKDKKLVGLFYGSPIKEVYINTSWDKIYFAFTSSDNSHDYYQTGYIIGDEIFGITFCPGRDFVMPWTGRRKNE